MHLNAGGGETSHPPASLIRALSITSTDRAATRTALDPARLRAGRRGMPRTSFEAKNGGNQGRRAFPQP